MPVHVMHLRWDDLTATGLRTAESLLAGLQPGRTPGCRCATHRRQGSSLFTTVLWDSEASAQAFADEHLAPALSTGGLRDPRATLFWVPEVYAAGYRPPAPRAPAPRDPGRAWRVPTVDAG